MRLDETIGEERLRGSAKWTEMELTFGGFCGEARRLVGSQLTGPEARREKDDGGTVVSSERCNWCRPPVRFLTWVEGCLNSGPEVDVMRWLCSWVCTSLRVTGGGPEGLKRLLLTRPGLPGLPGNESLLLGSLSGQAVFKFSDCKRNIGWW